MSNYETYTDVSRTAIFWGIAWRLDEGCWPEGVVGLSDEEAAQWFSTAFDLQVTIENFSRTSTRFKRSL